MMGTVFGFILMAIGMAGSFIMCDHDICMAKNDTVIHFIDAVCLVVYAIGFHLLLTSA